MFCYHSSLPPYVSGKVELGGKVRLYVRLDPKIQAEKVFVRSAPEGEEVMTEALPCEGFGRGGSWKWFAAELPVTVPQLGYRFRIMTPEGAFWLTASGVTRYTPTDAGDFRLVCQGPPAWVYDSIFYQIFPERFASSGRAQKPYSGEYEIDDEPIIAKDWDEPLSSKGDGRTFYGGDLWGIADHLGYIADLGANALYLNPIFTAPSSHKYDVADYHHVDIHFGGDEALEDLREKTREAGMRLVLDVVPNHCGKTNEWFLRAQEDPHAPEAEFFTFRHRPDDYECWLGVSSLPRFNYKSSLLRHMMYGDDDAVLRYWLRPPYSIDGWRLDVANMLARRGPEQLGHKIGRAIRRAVKDENPKAWILGEHFFDGTSHLQGDELDATMNYRGFMMPVLQWLCGTENDAFMSRPWADRSYLPTADFAAQLNIFRSSVPEAISLCQFNLIGSHDTPRFLTMAGGDKEKLKAAVALMFGYQGVPCIYYGDEIGMEGGRDPGCRAPMIWDEDKWDKDLRGHFRKLCRIRKQSEALRHGGLQMLYAEGDCVAFLRESQHDRAIVIISRGGSCDSIPAASADLPDGERYEDAINGGTFTVEHGAIAAPMQGVSARILLRK